MNNTLAELASQDVLMLAYENQAITYAEWETDPRILRARKVLNFTAKQALAWAREQGGFCEPNSQA